MATQTVQTVSDIPKALEPFYTEKDTGLIPRGVSEIFRSFGDRYAPVQGYMGERQIADMSQFQKDVGERLRNMQIPGQFGLATEAGQQSAAGLQALMGTQARMGVAAPELTQFQLDPARQFTGAESQQYMSPYIQGVVDVQQRKAIDAARQAQLGQNLAAARQGTYGGARQALLQGQRESGLRTQLGDIQAQGLQSAFDQAQQQFERDRAAQMGIGQQNLAAALGVQQLGAGQSLEAQRANQAAALQAAGQRQQAATGLGQLAQTFGGLGTQQLAGELDITKTMGAYGDLERAIAQQKRDAERSYLMQQAEYGLGQVGDLSNLLRGIPMTDTTQQVSTPPPSFASQLTGLGLTGISLYNLLGNK
jgi:hypothetical protein